MMEDHDDAMVAEAVPPPAGEEEARGGGGGGGDAATGERLLLPENEASEVAAKAAAGGESVAVPVGAGTDDARSSTGPALRLSKAGAITGTAVDDVADGMSRTQLDDYYSSNPGASSFDAEDDDFQQRGGIEGAIPVDKLKNGAATAFSFLQWGASKVTEQAKGVSERLNENENFRQASERMGTLYQERVKPGFEVVREGASNAYEKAKPAVENFTERAKPVLEEGWTVTKEKVGQLGEACKPGMDRAAESTREAFERVKSSATGSAAPPSSSSHKKDDGDEPPFTEI